MSYFINTTTGEIVKPRYRYRQNLVTGIVECLTPTLPQKTAKPRVNHRPETTTNSFNFKTVRFPNQPGLCPKCLGRGIVTSQLDGKVLGVCFWCDGKGKINDADIANAHRRERAGQTLDCRQSL